MTNGLPKKRTNGFSLVEALLGVSVFALIITGFAGSYFYGQESTVLAGDRTRAVAFAEEGLEAVRNIRDDDFNNLSDGTYGLEVSGGQWELSGSADSRDGFTREVTISSAGTNRKKVVVDVTWEQNARRDDTVTLTSRLTYWQEVKKQGNQGGNNQGGGNQGGQGGQGN